LSIAHIDGAVTKLSIGREFQKYSLSIAIRPPHRSSVVWDPQTRNEHNSMITMVLVWPWNLGPGANPIESPSQRPIGKLLPYSSEKFPFPAFVPSRGHLNMRPARASSNATGAVARSRRLAFLLCSNCSLTTEFWIKRLEVNHLNFELALPDCLRQDGSGEKGFETSDLEFVFHVERERPRSFPQK
jgi:hypothetical protein